MAHVDEESLESIDARIAQLHTRHRDEVARHEKRDRAARACACTVLGSCGNWRSLDPGRFATTHPRPRRHPTTIPRGWATVSVRGARLRRRSGNGRWQPLYSRELSDERHA